MLALLFCLTAQLVFLTYASSVIEKSGTHLSSELSSICMALVQMFATFVAYILIDRKGRKFLVVASMFGCTLGHAAMVAFLYLYNNGFDTSMFHWTPIICICFIVFISAIGIGSLTFTCMAELFPPKTRSFGLTFGTVVLNIIMFIFTKIFPLLMEAIGLERCLMIFCVSCALGTLYSVFLIEETKGKELNIVGEAKLSPKDSFSAK